MKYETISNCKTCIIMDFMTIGPPPSLEDENADFENDWIDSMEKCFQVLSYNEDEKM